MKNFYGKLKYKLTVFFLYIFLSFRHAKKNIKRNILILAITFSGFLSISLIACLSQSMLDYQKNITIYSLPGMLQIHKKGFLGNIFKNNSSFYFEDNEKNRSNITSAMDSIAYSPRISFDGIIVSNLENNQQKNYYSNIVAVNQNYERKISKYLSKWLLGKTSNFDFSIKENEIILSSENKDLFLKPKNQLPMLVTNDIEGLYSAELVKPSAFFTDLAPYEANIIDLDYARKLLHIKNNQIMEYAIFIDDLSQIDLVKTKLQQRFGNEFEVLAWYDIYKGVKNSIDSQKYIYNLFFVLLIFLVLMANYIIIFMILNERKKEIGIMFSLGIPPRNLQKLYFLEGFIVGFFGNFFGFIGFYIIKIIVNINGILIPSGNSQYPTIYRVYLEYSNDKLLFILIGMAILIGLFYDIRFYVFSKMSAIRLLRKI